MEPVGASLEGEWSCLSGMYTNEEADFMAHLLWSSHESGTMNHYDSSCSTYSGASSFNFSSSSQESYFFSDSNPVLVDNQCTILIDFYVEDEMNAASYIVEGNDNFLNQEISHGNVQESAQPDSNFHAKTETLTEDKSNTANPSEISKKRSRNTKGADKTKRNVRSKKSQDLASSSKNEEERNAGLNGPASSSCCSDDESNASHELNAGSGSSSLNAKATTALNSNSKTRASRGTATDPQSLYARKRREKINERLRILQNLVPNGTKVDMSTMLEEAVHYVKFLQLQIKLLSSDDLWMYAPIAYNGMDIGLDRKLPAVR